MGMLLPHRHRRKNRAWTPPIEQSVIFDGAAYLSRTPGSAGNRRTFTIAMWVRRSRFGTGQVWTLASAGPNGSTYSTLNFGAASFAGGDNLVFGDSSGPILVSTQVFRDIGWYHIAAAVDTTQAISSDRVKLYVNGVQITSFGTTTYPGLNFDFHFNNNTIHELGRRISTGSSEHHGAMADIHFLDGTALTEAQINATFLDGVVFDGQTIPAPKAVTGLTYGTNGFHLAFADSAAFGDDTSGNGNNWTPTGFVAGDQTADVPGWEMASWNPLDPRTTKPAVMLLNGIVQNTTAAWRSAIVGRAIPKTGVTYWEYEITRSTGNARHCACIANDGAQNSTLLLSSTIGNVYGIYDSSPVTKSSGGGATAALPSSVNWTTGRVGFTFDADAGTLAVQIGATDMGVIYSGIDTTRDWFPAASLYDEDARIYFNPSDWTLTVPTGAQTLWSPYMPTPEHHPQNHIAVGTRTGTGAAYSVTNGPANGTDFLWGKGRSGATDHYWYDIVRGVEKQLESNTTTAETTEATGLTAFNATGYSGGALAQMNTSAATYVDLMLKAGGTPVANTDGTIASTVSVAAPGHFGIAKWTGNGVAGATIGHGMGGVPEVIITKRTNTVSGWIAYHKNMNATPQNGYLFLDSTAAYAALSTTWNNTAPGSSVFTVGSNLGTNGSADTLIAYLFRSIPGVCKVGSYTGNGSADGPLIDLGFTARWILFKRADSTGDWKIHDTLRGSNGNFFDLVANSSAVESTGAGFDILSSQIKIRMTSANYNGSGNTIIYLALADIPGGGDLPWPLAR